MTETRERDIVRAFVDLSNELVDEYDVVEMLSLLTMSCATLLDVASAGLLLADGTGTLHLMASSSDHAPHLELFEIQREEGPCLDCFAGGEQVLVADLALEERRWPTFCRAAAAMGFRSVHALPMRLRETMLGTLALVGEETGLLDEHDLALAQALVHVASVAIVNERAAADLATINAQLRHALTSRIVLEQAKGVVAQTGGIDMEGAFAVLRRYARDHGRRLSDVATAVVHRELPGERLLEHARSATKPS